MKIIDVIGAVFVIIVIMMTVLLYKGRFSGPGVEVRDFSIQEIPNAPPPVRPQHDKINIGD